MIVNTIRNHHPDRPMSWRRLTATAIPGVKMARELMVSRTADPPNNNASMTVAAMESSCENKVHNQYSDRLDMVRKPK